MFSLWYIDSYGVSSYPDTGTHLLTVFEFIFPIFNPLQSRVSFPGIIPSPRIYTMVSRHILNRHLFISGAIF
jgi:hypothetical protein